MAVDRMEVEARLENFSKEVERCRAERTSKRAFFSKELRREALDLLESGMSLSEISERSQLQASVISKWRKRSAQNFRRVKIIEKSASLNSLFLKTPRGFEVHGLDFEKIQVLLDRGVLS